MNEAKCEIAVYGLWHLGSILCAAWSKLGHSVRGIDPDKKVIADFEQGEAPIFEPGLNELISENIRSGRLSFTTDVSVVKKASIVFIAYDTPIDDQDRSSLEIVEKAVDAILPHLAQSSILVLSAQLPVGTSCRLRTRIQKVKPNVELAYSPENLRLGEAIQCYLKPGHIVVGTENKGASARLKELFKPMTAEIAEVNLSTAEMIKHGINSFLAVSISLANQLSDLCEVSGADVTQVIDVMRMDPRIGPRSYLTPGLGFSGGTLGRDLQVLEGLSNQNKNLSPLFGEVWKWNQERYHQVRKTLESALGNLTGRTITIFGLTYKPGTSTLRRSLPLKAALDLTEAGAMIKVFDPRANYNEEPSVKKFVICEDASEAARDSEGIVVLTPWPEFLQLRWDELMKQMKNPLLLDPSNFLKNLVPGKVDFHYIGSGRGYLK